MNTTNTRNTLPATINYIKIELEDIRQFVDSMQEDDAITSISILMDECDDMDETYGFRVAKDILRLGSNINTLRKRLDEIYFKLFPEA